MKAKETIIQRSGTFLGNQALLCAMIWKVKLVCAYCVFIEFERALFTTRVGKVSKHGSSEWLKNRIHVIPWYSSKYALSDVTLQLHFLPQISKAKAQQIKYVSAGSKQVSKKAQWMLLINAI